MDVLSANKQMFPIFHPITEQFLFYKERDKVHVDGDWHRGVQANIIRKNDKGTFDILLQLRSETVDIGKGKFDQSLATQMLQEDNLDQLQTLKRGLLQELGVTAFHYEKLEMNIRIIKTYEEQKELLNRELLSFYLVELTNPEELSIHSNKISELQWMEWHDFLNFFNKRREQFTKTGRFYFETDEVCQLIEQQSYACLKIKKTDTNALSVSDKIFLHINTKLGQRNTQVFHTEDSENVKNQLQPYV